MDRASAPARPSPPLPARPPVGGRFPLLPATLWRRSLAPDMGAAAVGPRAGFRARVVSAGPWPLRPPASAGGSRIYTRGVAHLPLGPLDTITPPPTIGQRAGAGGGHPHA